MRKLLDLIESGSIIVFAPIVVTYESIRLSQGWNEILGVVVAIAIAPGLAILSQIGKRSEKYLNNPWTWVLMLLLTILYWVVVVIIFGLIFRQAPPPPMINTM